MIDIQEFISVEIGNRGIIRLKNDFLKRINIFKFLKLCGFRRARYKNRWSYFQVSHSTIERVSFLKMKWFFIEFIKNGNYCNMPNGITIVDIQRWVYSDNPINKHPGLLEILDIELSLEQQEQLKI